MKSLHDFRINESEEINEGSKIKEIEKKYATKGSDKNGVWVYSESIANEIADKYNGDVQEDGSDWYVAIDESEMVNEAKVNRYYVWFRTPYQPDDTEEWVIYGKDEEDAYQKFKKKHQARSYYNWGIKQLKKGDKYFDEKDYTQIY